MTPKVAIIVGLFAATLALPANAQETGFVAGGDTFATGQSALLAGPVNKDAFLAGFDVRVAAPVGADAHAVGFDIDVENRIGGDIYAAGYTIDVRAPIGGDATLAGNAVSLQSDATVGGNARLAGAHVTISAPITGAALISAEVLNLNSTISGDVAFFGRSITFGPTAKITGKLTIHAPQPINVPVSVAEATQIAFERTDAPNYVAEAGKTAESVIGRVWPAVWISAIWTGLLVVIGTLFIAVAPRLITALEVESAHHPIRRFGLGVLAFAAVLGMVPLATATIFGILVVPFIIIFAVVGSVLAYLAGAYILGMRVAGAFVQVDTNLKRVAVLVSTLIVSVVLGLIPLLGWLVSLMLATFGFGAIASVTFERSLAQNPAATIHAIGAGQ